MLGWGGHGPPGPPATPRLVVWRNSRRNPVSTCTTSEAIPASIPAAIPVVARIGTVLLFALIFYVELRNNCSCSASSLLLCSFIVSKNYLVVGWIMEWCVFGFNECIRECIREFVCVCVCVCVCFRSFASFSIFDLFAFFDSSIFIDLFSDFSIFFPIFYRFFYFF